MLLELPLQCLVVYVYKWLHSRQTNLKAVANTLPPKRRRKNKLSFRTTFQCQIHVRLTKRREKNEFSFQGGLWTLGWRDIIASIRALAWVHWLHFHMYGILTSLKFSGCSSVIKAMWVDPCLLNMMCQYRTPIFLGTWRCLWHLLQESG